MATYHIPNQRGTLLPRVICSIVFCCFTFLYLYVYQADVLALTQHVLSDGQTIYNKTIGAVLITFILYLLHVGIYSVSRLPGIGYALTYFPSLLLLTVITGISGDVADSFSFGYWYIATPLLLLCCFLGIWAIWKMLPKQDLRRPYGIFSQTMWLNLIALVGMFLLVCLFSNHNDMFHYRSKMEVAIAKHQYEKALEVGKNAQKTDSNLVMLRAYALSKTGKMGERLFEYPSVGGSHALLPDGHSVKILMTPAADVFRYVGVVVKQQMPVLRYLEYIDRHKLAKKAAADYLLCAYLLDKDLDKFAEYLPKYYPVDSLLPKHYQEALVLYTHSRAHPKIVYHHDVVDADYQDYQAMAKKYPEDLVRKTKIRDIYGKTYWYYYQYRP